MDIQKIVDLIGESGKAARHESGQKTLGYLKDVLSLLPPEMSCQFDTGHNFGLGTVTWGREPAYGGEYFSHGEYSYADSETAYPSCYRGFYSDCTFNASKDYGISTVGHVLGMIKETIGKSFNGYKGGVNPFTDGTLVWGGLTSFTSCGDERQVIGVTVEDGVCVIKTAVLEGGDE